MKSNKQVMLVMMILLFSSLSVNTTSMGVNAQSTGGEVFLPERIEIDSFLTSGTTNDIFFKSTPYNSFLDHSYISTQSSYDLFSYEGKSEVDNGLFNPLIGQAQAPNADAVYHASNASSQFLDLRYTTAYYDITGGSTVNGVNQVVLFQDEYFGLKFSATIDEPLVFDFKLKGDADIVIVDILLVSPDGNIFNYNVISDEFETFINHFIPMVPTETGDYELFMTPVNNDLTLEYFRILNSPPVLDITSGYSARLVGTETTTQFFEFRDFNTTSDANVLDLVADVFYNDSVSSPDQLLGTLDLKFFTSSMMYPFGGDFPDTIFQYQENSTYVAVTATPPNDDDAFISGIKNELGLNKGFDVEFTFYGQILPVENFFPDTEFIIDDVEQPNDNHFIWETNDDHMIAFNHSTAGSAIITNLDDQSEVYTLTSSVNNILEVRDDVPIILPRGNWMVELTKVGGAGIAEIQILSTLSLNIDDPTNLAFNLNQPILIELSADVPIKEYFNFTLIDQMNTTVDVVFDLFDNNFNRLEFGSFTFEEYYSNPSTLVSNNNTEFGNTSPVSEYNMNTALLRIEAIGNEVFNPDGSSNATDTEEYQATFEVTRMNYLDVWQESNNQFGINPIVSNAAQSLNGSKTDLAFMYYFSSSNTASGYSLSITATNESYTLYIIADMNNIWRSVTPGAQVIDGITHYDYILEFATSEATTLGFLFFFNNVAANGTLEIELDQYLVSPSPSINLGMMNSVVYPDSRNPGLGDEGEGGVSSFFERNGTALLIGGGVLAVIAAAVFFYTRRTSGI